jgi:phosphoribosylglycinamide formyltransferase 1
MRILSPAFLARFPHRVINLHPSLLPAFPGRAAVAQALSRGVRVTGVTVHVVDEGVDSGPIILQEPVSVAYDDTPSTLLERLHVVERRLLTDAVRLFAAGRVRIEDGRTYVEGVEAE